MVCDTKLEQKHRKIEREKKKILMEYEKKKRKLEREKKKKIEANKREEKTVLKKKIRNNINKGFHPKYNYKYEKKGTRDNIIKAKTNIAKKLVDNKFNQNTKFIFQVQYDRLLFLLQIRDMYNAQIETHKIKSQLALNEKQIQQQLNLIQFTNPDLFAKITHGLVKK